MAENQAKNPESIFTEIYQTYQETILRYCTAKCDYDAETASEISQEVFTTLWAEMQERADLPAAYIQPWLRTVADHRLSDYYKKRDAFRRHTVPIDQVDEKIFSISVDMEEERKLRILNHNIEEYCQQILNSLSAGNKQFFVWYYIEHLKYRDIAKMTGKTELALRLQNYRLRRQIKYITRKLFKAL